MTRDLWEIYQDENSGVFYTERRIIINEENFKSYNSSKDLLFFANQKTTKETPLITQNEYTNTQQTPTIKGQNQGIERLIEVDEEIDQEPCQVFPIGSPKVMFLPDELENKEQLITKVIERYFKDKNYEDINAYQLGEADEWSSNEGEFLPIQFYKKIEF